MDTTPVDLRTAAVIEAAEARAWVDLYGAAPLEFAEAAGLGTTEVSGALVLRWEASGRRYFNRTIGLGVVAPATPAVLDEILALYERAGIAMFLLQSLPGCRPADYERWLADRGLEPFDAQDRIVRDAAPLHISPDSAARGLEVERLMREDRDEWAQFVQRTYRLDTGPWLQALHDRPGWHQYVARENGEIVAARGMYIGSDGIAWLGMDAPVPGIMTSDYEPDAAICAAIVTEGLGRGVRMFIADIEAPSPGLDTPAYDAFARLGFRRPYVRTHWATSRTLRAADGVT